MGCTTSRTGHAPPNSGEGIRRRIPVQEAKSSKIDCMNLSCPVPYDDINLEASWILTPTGVLGKTSPITKFLHDKCGIEHSMSIEPLKDSPDCTNILFSALGFVTFYSDSKLLLSGMLTTTGSVIPRLKYNVFESFSCGATAELFNSPKCSFQFDYKGKDNRSRFAFRTSGLRCASFIQSVTPNFSLGTRLQWDSDGSVYDFVTRYSSNKTIATGGVSSNGLIRLSYVENFSEQVSFASEFNYAHSARYALSRFGCEYRIGGCLLRGQVDSDAVISSYYEGKFLLGSTFFLSSQIDPLKKKQTFGYGLRLAG